MEKILPTDVTVDILSRLPTESIYQCKQVCKSWRSLINHDRMFTRKYQSRLYEQNNAAGDAASGRMISFIFSIARQFNRTKRFYYAKYAPYERVMEYTRINLIPMDDSKVYRFVGSCNGLVCISPDQDRGMEQRIYICNPVTKEYLLLPSLCYTTPGSCNYFNCGFGYIPSTNEYKVVKIHECDGEVGKWVYVYTLGSGKGWRYISEITYKLSYTGVTFNGALHWVDMTQGNIVAFDLAEEKFSMISLTPTCFINNWPLDREFSDFELQVLGGSLCVVHQYYDTWYDIWSLKKGNNGNEYSHWSRDFNAFEFQGQWGSVKVFAVTKDDEALFSDAYKFYSHDLKQTRDNKLECGLNFVRNMDMDVRDALLHVNSYVSLKALGEEDTKIFESTELNNFDEVHIRNCTCHEDGDFSICKKARSQSRKGSESWVESGLEVSRRRYSSIWR